MKKITVLDILYPRRCPVCGDIVKPAGSLICPSCFPKLSLVMSPTCRKCGKELADETIEYCADCQRHHRTFEQGIALFNYNDAVKHSMAQVKYSHKREYLDFYGEAMAARFGTVIRNMQVDAMVPVPIHRSRMRVRGFNQAEVLADILGERLGIAVEPDVLLRNRKTLPQKELSPSERLKNLAGAFRIGAIPKGVRSVLLVDDIYTTGSTVEACARVLRAGGIQRVYVAVICMAGGR